MIKNLFLCVGAQKSGTTWLHSVLKNHPDIFFPHVKEVHYFDTIYNGSILLSARKVERIKKIIENNKFALEKYFTDLSQGLPVDSGIKNLLSPVNDQWYLDLFRKNKKKYAADFSPEYALLPSEGFKCVKKLSENRKIIFLMRDPVSRSKSAIQYFFQMKGDNDNISEEEIWNVVNKGFAVNMSKYQNTIKILKEEFSDNELLFMFFENIMENKQKAINKICDFLEIEHKTVNLNELEEKVNESKKIDFPKNLDDFLLENLVDTYKFVSSEFCEIPSKWRLVA